MNSITTALKKLLLLLLLLCSQHVFAQITTVKGVVKDDKTGEVLPFVTVSFDGTTIGVNTDLNGAFELTAHRKVSAIKVTSVGYETKIISFTGTSVFLEVNLTGDSKVLEEVIVKKKRIRYRNKNNPAVDLIRQVIEHKESNRNRSYDFLTFQEYEKVIFGLSHTEEGLKKHPLIKRFPHLITGIDTTIVEDKAVLPLYIEEVISKNYFKKSPSKTKKVIEGEKKVTLDENLFDNAGLDAYIKHIYQPIDVYDNNVMLITNQFLSPLADLSPTFYMFDIVDTVSIGTDKFASVYFTPRNKEDFLFTGNMLVSLDSNYAVTKINLRVGKNVNLNWVKNLDVSQEFTKNENGKYNLSRSALTADFGISQKSKAGIYGQRMISYKDYHVNQPINDEVFDGKKKEEEHIPVSDEYWQENRHEAISDKEDLIYKNLDSLQNTKTFKRIANALSLAISGYSNITPYFEIGPVNTFYSFNPVEGFRLRAGGRTTKELHPNIYFEGYGAYGFKDQKWKYYVGTIYSFTGKNRYMFPAKNISLTYQDDVKIPGQDLQFVQEDNFLLSFKRGVNDKWLYNKTWTFEYHQEFENRMSYRLGYKNWLQNPAGGIIYNQIGSELNVTDLTTSELYGEFRWAPNEKFYQGKTYRIPFPNKYPIITLRASAGIRGFINGQHDYQRVNLNVYKRIFMSQLGFTDAVLDAGYVFGSNIPYPLLDIHRANQTYSYQLRSYNLMNFMEFVSDRYVSMQMEHTFNGFFFNKIPLIKKLQFREFVTFKILYGGLRDENKPTEGKNLIAFPTDEEGNVSTFTLSQKPYMEGSLGVGNIFKIFRVDYVWRFSYLDNPNVSKGGIRMRFKFDF